MFVNGPRKPSDTLRNWTLEIKLCSVYSQLISTQSWLWKFTLSVVLCESSWSLSLSDAGWREKESSADLTEMFIPENSLETFHNRFTVVTPRAGCKLKVWNDVCYIWLIRNILLQTNKNKIPVIHRRPVVISHLCTVAVCILLFTIVDMGENTGSIYFIRFIKINELM